MLAVVVSLVPGGDSLSGRVLDADGRAIAGATVGGGSAGGGAWRGVRARPAKGMSTRTVVPPTARESSIVSFAATETNSP